MGGLFGNLFDFNHDGKLSASEEAADFAAFACMMDAARADEKRSELQNAGFDVNMLDTLDPSVRRSVLSDAGFDPDDFE